MISQLGRLPGTNLFERRLGLAVAVTMFLALATEASASAPLSLAEAERIAISAEPGEQAMLERAASLEQQSIVARQLPDPVFRVGVNNYPIDSGGFSTEGMTHAAIGVRQTFPRGDVLELQGRQLGARAQGMRDNANARVRDVRTSVRLAWLDVWYWQETRTLVGQSRPLFADLSDITLSLYSVGRKNQQDVLRAELELSRIDDRLIEIDRQLASAKASLREWIGEDAERPLAGRLPDRSETPPESELLRRLDTHPTLLAADADILASDTGVELAEERRKPTWSVDVGYSYREGTLASGQPRSDFVSVGVTVGLPFFRRTAVDSTLSAALHDRSAAESRREQLFRQLTRELESEYARWRDLERRLALYSERLLLQSSQRAEAALLAYQSDDADFDDVMRGYIEDLNAQVDFIRMQVEREQSYAVLANLGGLDNE